MIQMTNKEKYSDIILEFAISHNQMAVYNDSKKPAAGCDVGCSNCLFMYCGGCGGSYLAAREWAESEYVEKPCISKRDRAFLDYIGERAEWMTKDCNGEISVWTTKPKKSVNFCAWMDGLYNCLSMSNIDFPMVKWSDEEPWKIEDLKKLEVVDEY